MTTASAPRHGDPDVLEAQNPATLEPLGASPITGPGRLDRLIADGHASSKSWRTDIEARRTALTAISDALLAGIGRLEQFGPVFPIVGYDDLDAVVTTVDGQEFGLGASVWGPDAEAARAAAERIDAGTVWINQHNALDVALPFGGVKASGFGREGGIAGIEEFVTTRVIDPRPAG